MEFSWVTCEIRLKCCHQYNNTTRHYTKAKNNMVSVKLFEDTKNTEAEPRDKLKNEK